MKNRIQKTLKGSLVAILASSTILPIASAANVEELELELKGVVLKQGDKLLSLPVNLYKAALVEKIVSADMITHVISSNDKTYTLSIYKSALVESRGSIEEALKLLDDLGIVTDVNVIPGAIEDGKLVPKENTTKENETKRYLAS